MKFTSLGFAAAAMLLTGCGANPMLHVSNQVFNLGQSLPDDMVNQHLAGVVGFDEDWAGNYRSQARTALYGQGLEKETPEYGYRVVRINLNQTGSALWISKGELGWYTGAYVPDHLGRLHAGDIVEVRQTGTWKTMENFATRGEGNIVVRVLCYKADPEYLKCLDKGPSVGKIRGVGATNTPYPDSVKDYGYSFTPMFDAKGTALRAYPQTPVTPAP